MFEEFLYNCGCVASLECGPLLFSLPTLIIPKWKHSQLGGFRVIFCFQKIFIFDDKEIQTSGRRQLGAVSSSYMLLFGGENFLFIYFIFFP